MSNLAIFNDPDKRSISIPNQLRVLHGTHVDFSLLGKKPDFVRFSKRNSDLRFLLHSCIQCLFRHSRGSLL